MLPLNPETDLQPGDKVLFVGIPDAAVVRAAAARLTAGVLVAIDPDNNAVRAARRDCSGLHNAMFVWAPPDEIPWQERYFDKVFDTRDGSWPDPAKVAAEIQRVWRRL